VIGVSMEDTGGRAPLYCTSRWQTLHTLVTLTHQSHTLADASDCQYVTVRVSVTDVWM
jgi:hypothetical protein